MSGSSDTSDTSDTSITVKGPREKAKKTISLILATSTNYGIGFENKMCWNIPEELKSFRDITSTVNDNTKKNCVIMGKNTWFSLPNPPLKNRINLVISANDYQKLKKELECDDIKVFKNIEDTLQYVNDTDIIESAFVIGGARLYNDFLDNYISDINYIYFTIVFDKKYECDRYVAANIIFDNFKFEKCDITRNEKYISMKGENKYRLMPIDEPPD
jgi:dihydrofolate reductase